MKIRTEHQNLGAALMQVAEHDKFTAINPLKLQGEKINNAFLINADTCLFLKYGQEPKGTGEYQFTFHIDQLAKILAAAKHYQKVFIGLVCVEDQEVCCIDVTELGDMIGARRSSAGANEETYQVLVTVPEGKGMRVYMNASGRKGLTAGKAKIIPRKRFPSCLLEQE